MGGHACALLMLTAGWCNGQVKPDTCSGSFVVKLTLKRQGRLIPQL
jgi:hypothetical protein